MEKLIIWASVIAIIYHFLNRYMKKLKLSQLSYKIDFMLNQDSIN